MIEGLENRRMLSGITVDQSGDTHVAGHMTLRDAITQANSDPAGDIITFANTVTGTITLTQGVITISNSMTITGPGAAVLTVSGGTTSQIFNVNNGSPSVAAVSISGLTLFHGNAGAGKGGAIDNSENLALSGDVITGNTANAGGGVANEIGATLTSSNDTFSLNSAINSGGAINNAGVLNSSNDTFSTNTASTGGGGINNTGTFTATNDTIYGNSSTNGGGGIASAGTLTTFNTSIAANDGTGVEITGNKWTSVNTIVAGNTGGGNPSDVVRTTGTIAASFDLIGDAATSGGITNAVNGNIVGRATNTIFANVGGVPVLANNGGPTNTIALIPGSAAINAGGAITTSKAAVASSALPTSILVTSSAGIVPGDLLRIDNEIILVTSIPDGTHILVNRGQLGTAVSAHLINAPIMMGVDQRGDARGLPDIGSFAVARTIVVTIGGDTELPGLITLRDAVNEANIEAPGDTIAFATNVTGTTVLSQGEIPITNAMTITGPGAGVLTESANNASRIFDINAASPATFAVTISGLTLTQGNSASSSFNPGTGSAVYNNQNLTTSNDTFSFNTATSGGAIANAANLVSSNDTFSSNSAVIGGAITNLAGATASTSGDTFQGGISTSAGGGAVANAGNFTSTGDVYNSNVTQNGGSGGGFYNQISGTASLIGDTFTSNQASTGAGINNLGTLSSVGSTYSLNAATNAGGGIANNGIFTSANDTFYQNQATSGGGGIFNPGGTVLTTTNDTIADNFNIGVANSGTWNSLNTIVAGNWTTPAATTPSDIQSNGTINASHDLIGDAGSSGGITNGVNGNIVGIPTKSIFVTDVNGFPVLTNNGGTLQTIALVAGSPAINTGAVLANSTGIVANVTTPTTIVVDSTTFLAVGQLIRIDNEIMQVSSIVDATHAIVLRAKDGTTAAVHAAGPYTLATDERGFTRVTKDMGAVSAPTTIIVTIGGDTTTPGFTTLRDAVVQANALPAGETITFAPNVTGTITLTQGVIPITNSITIAGPGAAVLSVSGGNVSQVFSVTDSAATVQNVTITGLKLTKGAGGAKNGGAIDNFENLTLSNDVVTLNASAAGAGVYNEAGATLTSSNDTFSSNTSTATGGGIENAGTFNSTNDVISSNASVNGGGINNEKTGVITTNTDQFTANTASALSGAFGGGAINNIAAGIVTSTGDTFTSNSAKKNNSGSGGAIQNAGTMTITKATFTTNSADIGGALEVAGPTTTSATTFSGNTSTVQGGAIDVASKQPLNSTGDTISGNSSTANGGGIESAGTVVMVNDTVSGNSAVLGGGFDNNNGTFISNGSTFSGNSATTAGGVNNNTGAWTSTNDTIYGNSATNAGGGIDSSGTLITVNDTIANNTNTGVTLTGKTWTTQSTVIAGNKLPSNAASDVINFGGLGMVFAADTLVGNAGSAGGVVGGFGGNIVGAATNTIFATNAGGVPILANNGGPTKTVALIAGSPAIGAGGSITQSTAAVLQSAASTVIVVGSSADIVVGDFLRIDNEIILVTAIPDATHITVNRGQLNTAPAAHAPNAVVKMGIDQRGYARGVEDIGSYAIQRTITVTIAGDTETAGKITLRDAVNEADIETPGDTVTFAGSVTGVSKLTQGEIQISNAMTITGPGSLNYSGNTLFRVFDIESTAIPALPPFTVTITGLNISAANAIGSADHPGLGGGIYNAENLILTGDQFNTDHAVTGAGIYNVGTLTSTSVTYNSNTASSDGGGITNAGTLTTSKDTFTGNSASTGGGINNTATMTSSSDTFNSNVATTAGGGVNNLGTLTSTGDTFSSNTALAGGGVANLSNAPILSEVVSDTFTSNVAAIGGGLFNGGNLVSLGSTFNGNTASSSGGGIYNDSTMSSTNDTLTGNRANGAGGGGIFNNATLTTVNDTITANFMAGIDNAGTWNSLNTIVAGNFIAFGSTTPSDVINSGTINAISTLIGDAGSAGGITNGVNGNIVGATETAIFVTDINGNPILANNGGPTQTILLAAGSPALAVGAALSKSTAVIANSNAPTTFAVTSSTFFAVGDLVRIGLELMRVTAIPDSTHVTVQRAQNGSIAATHLANSPITLALDERGYGRGVNDLGAVSARRSIIVTIGGDTETAGFTTLRDAVFDANLEIPNETITFAANVTGTITLTQGELLITNSYTIAGPGALVLTVSGNNATRIFDVSSAAAAISATITGLTLTKGNSNSSTSNPGLGGAIYNSQTLTLTNDVFKSNTATTGGAVDNAGTLNSSSNTFSTNSATNGGALANTGSGTTSNDSFTGNTGTSGGGLYNNNTGQTFSVSGDTFSNNTAVSGGGAFNDSVGTLVINSSTFSGNTAFQASGGTGGGIDNVSGGIVQSTNDAFTNNTASGTGVNTNSGGAIFNAGTFTISGDLLSGNSAQTGGAIDNSGSLTSANANIDSNTATNGGGISNEAAGTANTSNDFFDRNSATASGGAILNFGTLTSGSDTITNSLATTGGGVSNALSATLSFDLFGGNTASQGGGVYNQATGTLTTSNTDYGNNVATAAAGGTGGGLYNVAAGVVNSSNDFFGNNSATGNNNGSGGGLFNAGTMTITTDVISSNSADLGGGLDNTGSLISNMTTYSGNSATANGGGVANGGNGQVGAMSSSYDTYSGNSAVHGGGLYTNGGTVKLINDTIAENTASQGAGIFNHLGTVNTLNVTIADNSADVAGGLGGGIANDGAATWNALNTIIAGNHQGLVATQIPSDFVAVSSGGTVSAANSLFGDPSTANGIVGGVNGNIVGKATNAIFVTDLNGVPVLANNGGPTQTIALLSGSPAIHAGSTTITTTTALLTAAGSAVTIQVASTANIAVGEFFRIDSEVFQVQTVLGSTSFFATRALKGTLGAVHTSGTALSLYDDQRGFARGVNDMGAFAPSRTIIVDISGDTETTGHTTLRDAVNQANVDAPGDTIVFSSSVAGTIVLTQGELPLLTSMTIEGSGSNVLAVSGGGVSRIFDINSSVALAITITGLKLTGGNSNGSSSNTGLGGAIYNNQTLTLTDDLFTLNTATRGGAIDNTGTLISSNDTFSGNSTTSGGGGGITSDGTLSSTNDTFTGNSAATGGGGILSDGQSTIASDVFSTNSAPLGGGIYNNGTMISADTTYNGNTATGSGGGLLNTGTLTSGSDTISGNSATNGGGIFNSGVLTLTNDTVADNTATNGGGILNALTLNTIHDTISGNAGSGIDNQGTWNSYNSLVIGNLIATGSTTPSDVVNTGTINAQFTLIGDTNSAGGIVNGASGNIVGEALNTVLATDASGNPLLANNGGPTKTIAMLGGAPGAAQGGSLATLAATITQTSSPTVIQVNSSQNIAVGDLLRIDSEIVLVTDVTDATDITVQRGQNGTVAAMHSVVNVPISLAVDQRGDSRFAADMGAVSAPRTIIVDVLGDTPVAGHVTLRDAVTMADAEGPGDTIMFAPGLTGTISLTQGELPITNAFTITGPGAGVLTVSGGTTSRIFYIATPSSTTNAVTISGLTLAQASSTTSPENVGLGGAIFNGEILTLFNDTFAGNAAQSIGPGGGGAIFNNGTLTSSHDLFTGNLARDGGAIDNAGMLTSAFDMFTGNTATNAGGAINNSHVLFATSDTFSANLALTGAGIVNTDVMNAMGDTYSGNTATSVAGGLLNAGTLNSTNETFFGNSGTNGGGLFNEAGTMTTVNDSIAGNFGNGVNITQGTWNSLNTIVAGNLLATGSTTKSDVLKSGGTINAVEALVGDAGSAGGIVNGTSGNIVGKPTNAIFVTDVNGVPVLANNGGPTQTIVLAPLSPAAGTGGRMAIAAAAIPLTNTPTTVLVNSSIYFQIGDLVTIDNEVVLVSAVQDPTHILIQRAQAGTAAAAHLANAPIILTTDQTGVTRINNDRGSLAVVNHAPVGTNGTINAIEDTVYTFKTADFGFTDPNDNPPNQLLAVKIAVLPLANVGTITDNGVPVTVGQFVSAADISAGNLTFTPQTGLRGLNVLGKFQVQDNGGTANGGQDLDPVGSVLDVQLAILNHAPVGTPGTVTAIVSAPYTFKTSDFGFTDPNDNPPDSLLAVKVAILPDPLVGTITDNNVAVTVGQFVSAADINAGDLIFTPVPGLLGLNVLGKFQVQDNGGTANGGIDLDPVGSVLDVQLVNGNHAPMGTSATINSFEETPYTFKTSDFGFTDPNDNPPNQLLAVKIALVPDADVGAITDNGVPVTVGQFVSATDISAGDLVFTPQPALTGLFFMGKYQVQDNGGTANGGKDLDPVGSVLDVQLAKINHAPVGTSATINSPQDAVYTFKSSDFGFTDPNDNPPNQLLAVKVTLVPDADVGTLNDNGNPVTVGQFVSVTDINAGHLTFTPQPGLTGLYFMGKYQVQDNGGTANGGHDLDPVGSVLDVKLLKVNHAPVGTSATINSPQDTVYTFKTSDFGFTDPNDNPPNQLLAVKVELVPDSDVGTLKDNNVPVSVGQFVSVADINAGHLTFTPQPGLTGLYFMGKYQVQDNGGTANGGHDLDPVGSVLDVQLLRVNHAPVGTPGTINAIEETPYTFKTADFGFTDPNDNPPNALLAVKVDVLPSVGTIEDGITPVSANQFVSAADISAGKVTFIPQPGLSGGPFFLGKFQVQDNGGTANGGHDLDPVGNILDVQLARVNHAPVGTSGTINSAASTPYTFKIPDFGFTDPNDNPPNQLLAVKITLVPDSDVGAITDNGVPVTVGQFVSAADISAGKMVFTPLPGLTGLYFMGKYQVQDNGGTANGGHDLDPVGSVLDVKLVKVNHAPMGTSATINSAENTTYTFKASDFGFTDPNDNPPNQLLAVKVALVPDADVGILDDSGVPVSPNQFVSVADINAGNLTFTPQQGLTGLYFMGKYQVQDNGGTANGGHDLDPVGSVLDVQLLKVNHAPVGTSATINSAENATYTFKTSDFGFTDPNDNPPNQLLAAKVAIVPDPGVGLLKDNNTPVTAGQFVSVTDINAGNLTFTPQPGLTGLYFMGKYQVQDNGGTANGGHDLDPLGSVLDVQLLKVNHAPVGTSATVTTLQGASYTFKTSDFGFSDSNDNPPNTLLAVKIPVLPSASVGQISDNGVPVAANQFVSAADISAGNLIFIPKAGLSGGPFQVFQFQVQDNGGTANGGVDLDPTARVMSANILRVNHAPVGTSATVATTKNKAYTFKVTDFGFKDPNDNPPDSFVAVKIASFTTASGKLTDKGVAVTVGQFVSVADIQAGKLVFTPKNNLTGGPLLVCTFQVQDSGGTANGGTDLDPNAKSLSIKIS